MTLEQMKIEYARLQAENTALKADANKPRKLTLKVSQKGALSLYGMGKFPVTLYKEQWLKLIAHGDALKAFIAANDTALKAKGDSTEVVAPAQA